MVVGDHDLCPLNLADKVSGHEFAVLVIIVRVAWQEDTQAITNGDAGSAYQEAAGEGLARGAADSVHGLPGNKHGDDGGFAGAGGEL